MLQKIFILVSFSLSILLVVTKCGVTVFDKTQDIEMVDVCTNESYAEYCKPIGACKAGTHIMCESWRNGQVMGPQCTNARMMKLRKSTKELILDAINEIRIELANGKEHVKDDAKVPQAYGMFKLSWDRDLATFAQVWANQCRLKREDACRATKRFHNPAQMVNVEEFPAPTEAGAQKDCVTHHRLLEAIRSSIRAWKLYKTYTTVGMLTHYEEIFVDGVPIKNYYLMLAFHNATHIGCAMSAYDTFTMDIVRAKHSSYALQLVCNLSHQASVGSPVILTDKPKTSLGYTEKCGCPPNSPEDKSCLCLLNAQTDHSETNSSTNNGNTTTDPSMNEDKTTDPSMNEDKTTDTSMNGGNATDPSKNGDVTTQPSSTEDKETDPSKNGDKATQPSSTEDKRTESSINGDKNTRPSSSENRGTESSVDKDKAANQSSTEDKRTESSVDKDNSAKPSSTEERTAHSPVNEGDGYPDNVYSYLGQSKQQVLILPIITVADAPPERYQQQMRSINEKLQGYSKRVFSPKDLISNIDQVTIEKPPIKKKNSIFTNVPTFHLPSQNKNINRRKEEPKENVSLKKKLKDLLEEVPRKLLSRFEEALESMKQRRRQNNVISTNTVHPVSIRVYNEVILGNTATQKMEDVDLRKNEYNAQNIAYQGQGESRIQNSKESYGNKQFWSEHTKTPGNLRGDKDNAMIRTVDRMNNGDRALQSQSQFAIPVLRKQIPIAYVKVTSNRLPNIYESKINMGNHRTEHMKKAFTDENKALINYKLGGQIQDTDDNKLKRRMFLENEISKLKRKLLHLRQYIRQNDMTESDRFRPMVRSHSSNNQRRNIKSNDFYMPDRAHSLHDV